MSPTLALTPDRLRRQCNPEELGFSSTRDLEPVEGLIGQTRALGALNFGIDLEARGYNVFVLGAPASGRHNAVREFLINKARNKPAPDDWLYVHNFEEPHRPRAIRLPDGRGRQLATDMQALLDGLKTTMPAVFDSEDYQARRGAIDSEFRSTQENAFNEIAQKAESQDLRVIRTQTGIAIVPVQNGEIIEPAAMENLSEEVRQVIQERITGLQEELRHVMENVPRLDKDRRERVRELNRNLASVAVGQAINDLLVRYGEFDDVRDYLEQVRVDLIENAQLFVQAAEQSEAEDGQRMQQELPLDTRFNRYRANLLVGHTTVAGEDSEILEDQAPVIFEDSPGLGQLLGRIEHVPHMGAMLTDFTLIKAGALHRANGGYLVMDAERLLSSPMAWQALKRCLRAHCISITPPMMDVSTTTAITLEPEPIPLDAKIILIGQRGTFYALSQLDPDFMDLFKVAADFNETTEWQSDLKDYARLIAGIAQKMSTRPASAAAVAAIIEHAARLTDDTEKLTLQVGFLSELMRESDYWCGVDGKEIIEDTHVVKAIDQQIYRLDRIREQMHEQILRDTVLVDTSGEAVGQINGLSVLQIGNFRFGKPTRITARARMGSGELVDIEREVNLGGPLHSKGVLILTGFLSARYALNQPISLRGTLVFEQSYGGVDGDSASSTELYALMSALSGIPIKQGLSVTGSVNQKGEVQAIGGVNEKIEGFFDICESRGLTGEQGVLIPQSNVKNLMLRQYVVDAVSAGKFHIYAVSHIDEGIEILTGVEAGAPQEDGSFPIGSINRRVEDTLVSFAEERRRYYLGTTGFSA